MVKVNVATLKAKLSRYLEMAQKGILIVVTSHGEEIAKIGPAQLVTSAPVHWKSFFSKHPPIKPQRKGMPAGKLIRKIRDEE